MLHMEEMVAGKSQRPLVRSIQIARAKRLVEEDSKRVADIESKKLANKQAAESLAAQVQARADRQAAVASAAAALWGSQAKKRIEASKHTTASANMLSVPISTAGAASEPTRDVKKVIKKRKKGAPMEVSNRRARAPPCRPAASAKKQIIAPRDPRFDDMSGSLDLDLFHHKYAFLEEYRASELEDMRTQVSKLRRRRDERSRNQAAEVEAAIKRQLQEDKLRTRLGELRDEELATKKEEREKVRTTGKIPFFHKRGAVRKQLMEKRKQTKRGFGSKQPDERRERKEAAREKKRLPRQRR